MCNKSKKDIIDVSKYYAKNGKITVVAYAFFQPICLLYSKYIKLPGLPGFPHSIILLSATMLDSIINRLKYDNNQIQLDNPEFFLSYCKKNNILKIYDEYSEILLVRNIIAHNHVWFIEFNNNYDEISYELLMGRKNKLFNKYADLKQLRTKNYQLHINPDKIDQNDVDVVLQLSNNFIEKIFEIEKSNGKNVLNPYIRKIKHNGKMYSFKKFLSLYNLV